MALSIGEAEKWFNEVYLPDTSKFRVSKDGKSYKRKASWSRAQKPKNENHTEFGWVWTPLDYDDDARPGIITYDDETSYRRDLGKYYLQPIIEGIVIIKVNNEKKAFLAQLAYDPFDLETNDFKLEKETFTGTLLRSDWNDNIIDGTTFVKGEKVQAFSNPDNPNINNKSGKENARVSGCFYTSIEYTTWYVDEDGILTIVGHTNWAVVCDISGNGGWGGGGGVYVDSTGGTSSGGGYNGPGGAYYDPLLGSGNGAWVMPSNMYYNFNLNNAINSPGSDRTAVNENLENALWGVGLATNISSWSIDKAVALAHSVGLNLREFFPMAVVAGRYIGVAGLAMSTRTLYIGLSDGYTFDEDGWNIALTALSGTTVALTFVAASPWIAVAVGAVTITIAVVQQVNND